MNEYSSFETLYKAKFPNGRVLILMQIGSFFEIYQTEEVLEYISTLTHLQVTRKNKKLPASPRNPHLVGFPVHSQAKYISILLQHGYTIVVVVEVSGGGDSGMPVQREVSQVLSPGLAVDYIQNEDHQYIFVIAVDTGVSGGLPAVRPEGARGGFAAVPHTVYALAAIDVHSSVQYVSEFTSISDILHWIQTLQPRQILLPPTLSIPLDELFFKIPPLVDTFHTKWSSLRAQQQEFARIFKETGLMTPIEYIGLERHPLVAEAYAALLHYVSEHSPQLLTRIGIPTWISSEHFMYIPASSLRQLDIISQRMSVISLLNRCKTAMGRRYFKYRCMHPYAKVVDIEREYEHVEWYMNNMNSAAGPLSKIPDLERLFRTIQMGTANIQTMQSIRDAVSVFSNIPVMEPRPYDIAPLETLCNQIADDMDQWLHQTIDPQLDTLVAECTNIRSKVEQFVESICLKLATRSTKSTAPTQPVKLEMDRGIFRITMTWHRWLQLKPILETPPLGGAGDWRGIAVDKWANKNSDTPKVYLVHPILTQWNDQWVVAKSTLKNYSDERWKVFHSELLQYPYYTDIVEWIQHIDYWSTNAENALKFGYTRPSIDTQGNKLTAVAIRHPLIEQIQTNLVYTPNDIKFINNRIGYLIYGINAAGKSSLMKSVGIAYIMAQAGMYVAAQSFKYTPITQLFTRIPSGDNIHMGQSTFAVEISELRTILQRANESTLVVGDELASGTEHISAISIVGAAMSMLCQRKIPFLFASHLHELLELDIIKQYIASGNIYVGHMHVEQMEDGSWVYRRKIQDGAGSNIYGLEVMESFNLPSEFIRIAHELRAEYTKTQPRKCRYNARVDISTTCMLCHQPTTEVHHIIPQRLADDNGRVEHVRMHAAYNLMAVCESCHDKIHTGQVEVNGYQQTSKGISIEARAPRRAINKN